MDDYSHNVAVMESKVYDFFLDGRKAWDESKVRSMFNSVDAETILKVRISQSNISDRVAWSHSNNGQYSVKSGYHYWQAIMSNNVEV